MAGFPRAVASSNYSVAVSSLNLGAGVYITRLRYTYLSLPPGFKVSGSSADPGFAAVLLANDRSGALINPGLVVSNTGTYSYTYNATPGTGSSAATLTVAAVPVGETLAVPKVDKAVVGTASVLPNGTVSYDLSLNNGGTAGATLANPVVGDLLDAGVDYVAGSWTVSSRPTGMPNPVFESIANYNGTGRTLLRWRFEGASAYALPANTTAKLRYTAKVKPGTLAGTITNTAYLLGYANATVNSGSCNTPMPADSNDLDGDGNKTETLCASKAGAANITVSASAALESVKWVKGQLDSGYSKYPGNGLTVAGGSLLYRLQVSNVGNVAIKNAQIIDILPFVGDSGVLDPQTRQSAWRPNLTAPVAAPAGVVVYYSTVANLCRPELGYSPAGCAAPNWSVTPPDDITRVQALKFDFGNIVLNPQDLLELNWPMRAPIGAPTQGQVAWNSFGYVATRADNGVALLPSEPVKVGVAVQAPQPPAYGDRVWLDANGNGLQDPSEVGLNGVRVDMVRADGTLVDSTLTTDNAAGKPGYYQFTNLTPGTFYAKFYPPAGYAVVAQNVGGDRGLDSDVDPASNTTAPLALAFGQTDYTWDLGLKVSSTASVGNYVWYDRNGNGLQDEAGNDGLNGVTVKAYATSNTTTPVATSATANDLNGNPGYYRFDNLAPGSYFLEFVKPAGASFTLRNAGTAQTGSQVDPSTGRTASFTVVAGQYAVNWDAGIILPTGSASLGDRVWVDANNNGVYEPFGGEQGVDGVRVNLYRDSDGNGVYSPGIDPFYATTATYTAGGSPGYYNFGQLPPGGFIAQIDPANFLAGKPLAGLLSSTVLADPANAVDNDNNGYLSTGLGALSKAIALAAAARQDLDFGFTANYNHFDTVGGGQYVLGFVPPDGYRFSPQDQGASSLHDSFDSDADANGKTAVVAVGGDMPTIDAGLYLSNGAAAARVADFVWYDSNHDGVQSAGEPGLGGVKVRLWDAGQKNLLAATVSDGRGFYQFAGLPAGGYVLEFAATVGYTRSPQHVGGDNTTDSDAAAATGLAPVTLAAGQNVDTVDAGFYLADSKPGDAAAQIGDAVWYDGNNDGVHDSGEPGAPGVTVNLYDTGDGSLLAKTKTDSRGAYAFAGLNAGHYTVEFVLPVGGYAFSPLGKDSLVDPTSGKLAVDLAKGQSRADIDAGLAIPKAPAISLGDSVWLDGNANLAFDKGEGLAQAQVVLYDSVGQELARLPTSAADANYLFTGVGPGSYRVAVDKSSLPANAAEIADPDAVFDSASDLANQKVGLASLDFGYSTHIDFGDLPDSYATLLAGNGARHLASGVYLGASATDVESDGQPTDKATGDDLNGATPDDEDGVSFVGLWTTGNSASLKVASSAAGVLNAWADWNQNGAFDSGERIIADKALAAGQTSLSVAVPATAAAGSKAFRFRVTDLKGQGGDSAAGIAKTGEVEDYRQPVYTAGQAGSIAGQVRGDDNGDGNLAAAYGGLAGAVVALYSDPNGDGDPADGAVVDSRTTGADGQYLFAVTATGSYVVVETNPAGYLSTNDAAPPSDDRIPVAMPPFFSTNDAVAPGTDDQIRVALSLASPNISGADFLDSQQPQSPPRPLGFVPIDSRPPTDTMAGQCTGTLNLFKDAAAKELETYRVDNGGALVFGINVMEAKEGTETAQSQGVAVQDASLVLVFSNGKQKTYSISGEMCYTETFSHDWHLRLNLPAAVSALVSCATSLPASPQTGFACGGGTPPITTGVADVLAFQDTGKIFPNPLFTDYRKAFSNTLQWPVEARAYQNGPKSVFSIALSQPVDPDTIGPVPFDPYLYVRDTKMTVQLLQVNAAIRDANGYPYAMLMPGNWNWPYERSDIRGTYPRFNGFVASQGTQSADWYNVPAPGVNYPAPKAATWAW